MTKYTPNLVKTDPATDIDTPSASDDDDGGGGGALKATRRTYAQSLRLIWCCFHPTLKRRSGGWRRAAHSRVFAIKDFFGRGGGVGRTGGKCYPSVSKKALQRNWEKCWYSRRGSARAVRLHTSRAPLLNYARVKAEKPHQTR